MISLGSALVGDPVSYRALTIFPLFMETKSSVVYELADDAIADGQVTVEELDAEGSIPDLIVDNKAASPVLFIEGDELVGAKQNRILNATVLVAAESRTKIPVSCVEAGRWRHQSPSLHYSGGSSSPKLRHFLKKSVGSSLKSKQGHRSDQGGVWNEVQRQMSSLGSSSETGAMADTYRACQERIQEFQERLGYVDGASGLIAALGKRVVAADLFDKPSTCEKVWARLLTGTIMDALEDEETDGPVQAEAARELLDRMDGLNWEPGPTVGLGEELRAEEADGVYGSTLVVDNTVVHSSVMVGE